MEATQLNVTSTKGPHRPHEHEDPTLREQSIAPERRPFQEASSLYSAPCQVPFCFDGEYSQTRGTTETIL